MKREDRHVGMRAVPDWTVRCQRAQRVRRVFDDQPWTGPKGAQVYGQTGEVHGDEGVDFSGDRLRIDVERVPVNVEQLWPGADIPGAVRARDKRECRRGDSVTGSDI